MQVKFQTNYIHIAPRKMRLVADLIRGLDVGEAEHQLLFSKKRGAKVISKTLHAAVASAVHNFSLDKDNLYISKISVSAGPVIKRFSAAAFGVVHPITKRTSHLALVLDERIVSKKAKKSKVKAEETKKEIEKTKEEKALPKVKAPKGASFEREKEKMTLPKPKGRGIIRRIFRRKSGA